MTATDLTVRSCPEKVERLDATLRQLREMILSAASFEVAIDEPRDEDDFDQQRSTLVLFRVRGRT